MDRFAQVPKPPVQEYVTNEAGAEVPLGTPPPASAVTASSPSVEVQPQVRPVGVVSVADFEEGARSTIITLRLKDKTKVGLRVIYDPNNLTEETNAYMKDLADDQDDVILARVLCETLLDWEMVGPLYAVETLYGEDHAILRDEKGAPKRTRVLVVPEEEKVPLDPEIMRHLKTSWLVQIWQEINRDALGDVPDPNSRKRSRRRSS